jgi:hypothetical protein
MAITRVTLATGVAATVALGAITTGCGSDTKVSSPPSTAAYSTTSGPAAATAAAQPTDYATMLITASDIGGDLDAVQPPVLNPNGAAGVAQLFANSDNSRRLLDTILIVGGPAMAAAGVEDAKRSHEGKVRGAWLPVDVGSNGAMISGTSPDNSQAVTVLAFSQGKALVTIEFDSAPNDPIDADVAKDIGRKQDNAIKKGLHS